MTAFGTFNPCETASKIAAIQITMDDIYYTRSPEPKTRGISIIPDLFERFEVGFNALVEGAGAGIAGAIDIKWAASIG
jgi:hypothetical protein